MSRKKTETPSSSGVSPRAIQARTPNQAKYLQAIDENHITLSYGPAGSGKDYCAIGKAVEYKMQNKVEKILICRPAVEAGERIGFLSGDFEEKLSPYVRHFYDILDEQIGASTVIGWQKSKTLEVIPLGLIRGRTLKNSFVILSEAQNATIEQLRMFITRIGQGSKMIINGDIGQSDLTKRLRGGFNYCIERLTNLDGVGIVELTSEDIIRHHLISHILERLEPHERE